MINVYDVPSGHESTESIESQSQFNPIVTPRLDLDPENAAKGIGQLALAIVNLLHELLERQAIRRMDNGTLSDDQIENLGKCLMMQSEAIDKLCEAFEIDRAELNLDLGPLGTLV